MPEELLPTIRAVAVRTKERAFQPGERVLRFVLEPLPGEHPYFPTELLYPEVRLPELLPISLQPPAIKSLILDIETTGIMPFNSRIICIGCLDLTTPEEPIIFYDEDETKLLREFLDFFTLNGYTQIIGYNVAFDYRFIFTKAMRFRLSCKEFHDATLLDLCQVLKQVKLEFVFNFNRPGKLSEWSEYLLNRRKQLTLQEVLKAWEEKRIQDILLHNRNAILLIRDIYLLYLVAKGDLRA